MGRRISPPGRVCSRVVTDADDPVLLAAWRRGDSSAGDALFSRHFSAVFRFFRNKVAEAVAEDLTQTTFLACVDGLERFRGDASFRTYLFSIARNQLLMHFRRSSRADASELPSTATVADFGPGPVTAVFARVEQKLLLHALRRIPVDSQIALELYYWEGMHPRDIAGVLDVPETTARSRIVRAREYLLQQVEALAESPEVLASTRGDFEAWARSLRALVP
jgi:RNA polymerase sigma factor (sigma-70 family)